jgi:archaemetzincin
MKEERESTGAKETGCRLLVTPLGVVDEIAVSVAAANIQAAFDLNVDVEPQQSCPDSAILQARPQYDAARIMAFLEHGLSPGTYRLGLTGEDISLAFLTYVYGEARIGGKTGVVSTCRLGKGGKGGFASRSTMYERVAKVTVHETGHLLGLMHCSRPDCVMNFSAGLDRLDRLTRTFCAGCRSFLHTHCGLPG